MLARLRQTKQQTPTEWTEWMAGKQRTVLNADAPPRRVVGQNVIANFWGMKNVAISPT